MFHDRKAAFPEVRSGRVTKSADDVLVEAEVLFSCLDGELAVESFTDTEIELARVGARGQWVWDRLTAGE